MSESEEVRGQWTRSRTRKQFRVCPGKARGGPGFTSTESSGKFGCLRGVAWTMQEGEGEKWWPGPRFQISLSYGSRWRTDPAVSPLLHTLKMESRSEDGRMQKSFKTRAQTLSPSVHPVQCHKMWTAERTARWILPPSPFHRQRHGNQSYKLTVTFPCPGRDRVPSKGTKSKLPGCPAVHLQSRSFSQRTQFCPIGTGRIGTTFPGSPGPRT